ncbi:MULTISPECIES: helix-turn-helix transcriptional regulator [unclassified Idiomarina]|jgi:predicted DNA-binding transcriptional regulator AlpA|uniref:helix-turn-helix transcriptional regulator n=1 Tax=unclassified Idiomarina TaxID=2614829 RepID=UPI000C90209C|nr:MULTISPECIES: AlpA family phage regulatory protein [unclassified Idiomarina]MAD53145.1 transcriptional regulator [Idiomarinaceae bacterium]|tara:strand:- start:19988 stop:20188 length:201 start_codon:yes stop_codon:yes gene_type:complete
MEHNQLIIRPAQLAEMLGVSTVTLWNWRRKKIMPEPLCFGPRFIGWKKDVITEWIDSQQNTTGDSL